MGEEGFGVFCADAVAEIATGGFDLVDDPALAGRVHLVVPELALVGFDGIELFLPLVGDVKEEAGVGVDVEVSGVVVNDFFGMVWFVGHVGFGELGGEAGIFDELAGVDMIGMGIGAIGCEKPTGFIFANGFGNHTAIFQINFEIAVG